MTDVTPAVEIPPQDRPSNPFSRMVGVLMSPNQTYAEIVRKPDWVVPALVLLVVSIVVVILMVPRIDFESTYRDAFASQGMGEQQQQQALKFAMAFGKATMYASPILSIGWLAVAAALYFLGVRMFGGQGTYLQAFSVTLYGWMPRVLKALITIPVFLSKHSIRMQEINTVVRSNLGFLVDVKEHPMLFTLASSLDAFTIWSLVVTAIGLAAMSKLSKAKTLAVVFVLWGIGILLAVGGAALGSLRAHR
jgi:hypothetical protein